MSKYVFPAILEKEDNGSYSVNLPDIPGSFTGGDDLEHAIEVAGGRSGFDALPL